MDAMGLWPILFLPWNLHTHTPRRLPFLPESCFRCFLECSRGISMAQKLAACCVGGRKPWGISRTGTRWKMNGWNLQITHFRTENDLPKTYDICSMLIFRDVCFFVFLVWYRGILLKVQHNSRKKNTWSFSRKLSSVACRFFWDRPLCCCLPANRWHGWRPEV